MFTQRPSVISDIRTGSPHIPATRQAVSLTGYGGLDRMAFVQDAPVLVPAAAVVPIQAGACGINNTDLWMGEGAYGEGE